MNHLKYLMPVAAFALVALFGCDSDSSSTEPNVKTENTKWYANNTTEPDSVEKNFENAVSTPDNSTGKDEPAKQDSNQDTYDGSTGLISCYYQMADVFRTRSCIQADVDYEKYLKKMCTTEAEGADGMVVSATLGNGFPSGATNVCVDKEKNTAVSAKIYYYGAVFNTMSCAELLEDGDDDTEVKDVTNSDKENSDPKQTVPVDVQDGETFACYGEDVCGVFPLDKYNRSECENDGGSIAAECPAGGTRCDGVIDGVQYYVYPGAFFDCEDIRDLAE